MRIWKSIFALCILYFTAALFPNVIPDIWIFLAILALVVIWRKKRVRRR